ncbi:MAG: DHH family phosphoesterase [archaeon]|jgi:nanoRNase/pAp phosphatase (c-di-AMP/oligoRNAs hydrolase)
MPKFTSKKLISLCKQKRVLLLCHDNADLDSFASAAMMQRYLKKNKIKSNIGVPCHINEQALHFALEEKISFNIHPNLEEYDLVLLFDLNGFEQMGHLRERFVQLIRNKSLKAIVFDHHVPEKESICAGANSVIDENAASTTEILYNFLDMHSDARISFWNCIGIIEDTGHFLVGDEKTFSSFANSLKYSKKTYAQVLSFARHKVPDDERVAFLKAAQRANIQKIGEVILLTSELSFYQSAAATKLLDFGAHIALVAGQEKNGLTTLSARAETEFKEKYRFNLVKDLLIPLQKRFGGEIGGHSGAAQWKGKMQTAVVLQTSASILKKRLS